MFNGLAGKLLSMIAVGGCDQNDDETPARNDTIVGFDDKIGDHVITEWVGEEDEWVLLDEIDDDSGSIACELDFVVAPSTINTSGSPSPLSAAEAMGWHMMPPPCFVASHHHHFRGRNKYKHVQHLNPNKMKNVRPGHASRANRDNHHRGGMDVSVFGNMLIEHPSLSVYHQQDPGIASSLSAPPHVLGFSQLTNGVATPRVKKPLQPISVDLQDKTKVAASKEPCGENKDPDLNSRVVPGRVESKANPTYVITGFDVCTSVAVPAPGERLEILPATSPSNSSHLRRAKRQHFTFYDASLSNKGGNKQRNNDKMKNAGNGSGGRPKILS